MAEGHRSSPPWQFFRLVGCFFGSSSYCNDLLPAPAVNFLSFYRKKARKTQITSWMVKAFPPCMWLPPEILRIRIKFKSQQPLLTIYHQKMAVLFRIKSQSAVHPYHRHPPHLKEGPRQQSQGADWSRHCIAISVCSRRDTPKLSVSPVQRQIPHLKALMHSSQAMVLPQIAGIYSMHAEPKHQALLKSYNMIKRLNF